MANIKVHFILETALFKMYRQLISYCAMLQLISYCAMLHFFILCNVALISYCAMLHLFHIVQCCTFSYCAMLHFFILCNVADPPAAVTLPALSTIEQEEPTSASELFGHSLKDDIREILGQETNPVEIPLVGIQCFDRWRLLWTCLLPCFLGNLS